MLLKIILNYEDCGRVMLGVVQAGLRKAEPRRSSAIFHPPPNLSCMLQQILSVTIRIIAY